MKWSEPSLGCTGFVVWGFVVNDCPASTKHSSKSDALSFAGAIFKSFSLHFETGSYFSVQAVSVRGRWISSYCRNFQGRNMKLIKTRFVQGVHGQLNFRHAIHAASRAIRCAARCVTVFKTPTLRTVAALLLFRGAISWAETAPPVAPGRTSAARVEAFFANLPLSFEANTGKFDRRVKFVSRGERQNLFLTNEGMVLTLNKGGSEVISIVRLEFQNAFAEAKFEGVDQLPAITNYFSAGVQITNVPNFSRVRQINAYPGIDVVYYGNSGRIEYDFIVSAGADAKRIKFKLSGHRSATVAESGDLVLGTYSGDVTLKKPVAYQERDGKRIDVPLRYVVAGNELRFDVSSYDRRRTLVIDPMLNYSTYLGGGSDDLAWAIALDASGNAYITGETFSTDFPLVGALQTKKAGPSDVFVTKMNANGTGLVYSTYIGGKSGSSVAKGIAVDTAGNAYITGSTVSSAYPVTAGAYITTFNGTGFVTKLNAQGNALVYSTFTGGDSNPRAIALDSSGNAFITGSAGSSFPTTPGVFQPAPFWPTAAIVLKLNATGTAAIYSTFLGGAGGSAGTGIAVDAAGNAYVVGMTDTGDIFPLVNAFRSSFGGVQDAFITKFNPTGTAVIYSSLLGGSAKDEAHAVAIDPQGNAYIAGTTYSNDFPVVRAFQPNKGVLNTSINNAFIAKVDPTGSVLVYSSYLGGNPISCSICSLSGDDDNGLAIAADAAGNAYMAGQARSPNFPQSEGFQGNQSVYGPAIPFIAKVADRSISTLEYSVTLGQKIGGTDFESGGATGVAVDANGSAYVAGYIGSSIMPATPGAFQPVAKSQFDAVVFKVSPGNFPTRLSASPTAPTSAQSVTLTATVSSAVPGGMVTFTDNGSSLATVAASAGAATYTTTLPAGVHQLTAVYSGDNKVSRPLFLPVSQATN